MADPISAAGLVMAALTLPAQLFSSGVVAYTTISQVRHMGNAFSTQYWLFKNQESRFLIWGQNLNVYGNGLDPNTMPMPVYELIVTTLVQITGLLQDAGGLTRRYGLQPLGETSSPDPSTFQRALARQSTQVFKLQRSASMWRKMQWAVMDKGRFAELVQQLTAFNDSLYQLHPLKNGPLVEIAVTAEIIAQTIVDKGVTGTQSVQLTTDTHLQGLRDSSRALDIAMRREDTEFAYDIPRGPSSPYVLFDQRYMDILAPTADDSPDRRAWARSNGQESFVIEWRVYDQFRVRGEMKDALQRRVQALVIMLQQKPRTSTFRVLDCMGFFEDNTQPRFGLVFRCPHEYVRQRDPNPITLFQAIVKYDRDVPYLGERFRLAYLLAESVLGMHTSKWLHKSISSHNILFFSKDQRPSITANQRPVSLKNPYFSGFAMSRPNDPHEDTSRAGVERVLGVYRHPDVQGFGERAVGRYRAIYDIYSLGAVLLEIGIWRPLAKLNPSPDTSSSDFKNLLLRKYVPMLGSAMGERYMVAVRKCLDGRFDGLMGFAGNQTESDEYNLQLQRCLVWEVVNILGDCRA